MYQALFNSDAIAGELVFLKKDGSLTKKAPHGNRCPKCQRFCRIQGIKSVCCNEELCLIPIGIVISRINDKQCWVQLA